MNPTAKIKLAWLMVLSVSASAFAANIVNDTWIDGTRTDPASPTYSENGTDSDVDGNLESAWYNTDNGTNMIVVDDSTAGGNQLLYTSFPGTGSASWTTYLTPEASPMTLVSAGDTLKITWVFRPQGVGAANTSQNFRVAVVDTPAANRLTGNGAPGSAAYAGYSMFMNMGAPTLGGSAFQLKERTDPATASAFLSASGSWTTSASGGPTSGEGYLNDSTYTFVMQFTLQSGGALEIISTMTGANIGGVGYLSVTNVDATPNSLSFDTFGIRPSSPAGTATNFYTSLFKVEFSTGGCTPTSFNVTGSGQICSGDMLAVGLSGSEAGYDYHLLMGGTPTGTILPGTGAALDFGALGAGTYTVYASNTTSTCEGLMSGNAVISQYADPVVTTNPSPASAVNTIGDTRVFKISATGPGLTYRWRKDYVELGDSGSISGAATATITLTNLVEGDSGYYDCVVSNSPCGVSVASSGASLSVSSGSGILFRTTGSSDWSDTGVWEQSSDGNSWSPASAAPSSYDSNILVRASHTITISSDQTADQMTIDSGGKVQLAGGSLTINNGNGIDLNVAGTLEIGASGGSFIIGSATLQFASGGVFDWNYAAAPVIPTATWLDGSTCRISAVSTSATSIISGIGGQDYYDLIYDTTTAGQSKNCKLNLRGNTTVRRDFTVNMPDSTGAKVYMNNDTNVVLTVGRNLTLAVSGVSDSNIKILLNDVTGSYSTMKIGGNFSVTGYLDGYGGATNYIEFNGTGTQTLSLPTLPYLVNSGTFHWKVDSGATVALANDLDGFLSFTNLGTLTFGGYKIIRGTALTLDAGCTVNANGTNMVITNINSVVLGGTLNLGSLPAFSGGESFQVINAAAYSGSVGTLLPSTPDGTHAWDTTQLNTAGILAVSGGTPPPTSIVFTQLSSSQVVLDWPTGYGWVLQSQTNDLSSGLSPTGWVDVSGATPPFTNLVVPGNPSVFYRLSHP